MKDGMLKVEEVAVMLNVSVKTINNWYSFKKQFPENSMAQILPEFEQENVRGVRLWNMNDIPKLVEFKNSLPQGRSGIMGAITQRYYHKRKENQNAEN